MQVNFSAHYRLHRCIQRVVDGKRQRLETCYSKLHEMSASCGTEIASMRAVVGEKIVGRQLEFGRTAFQLYIYDNIIRSHALVTVLIQIFKGRKFRCFRG